MTGPKEHNDEADATEASCLLNETDAPLSYIAFTSAKRRARQIAVRAQKGREDKQYVVVEDTITFDRENDNIKPSEEEVVEAKENSLLDEADSPPSGKISDAPKCRAR